MFAKLFIGIRLHCTLSNLVSLSMTRNAQTSSLRTLLSSSSANRGHSTMSLSWSVWQAMTSLMTSTVFKFCPSRFRFEPLEHIASSIRSCDVIGGHFKLMAGHRRNFHIIEIHGNKFLEPARKVQSDVSKCLCTGSRCPIFPEYIR